MCNVVGACHRSNWVLLQAPLGSLYIIRPEAWREVNGGGVEAPNQSDGPHAARGREGLAEHTYDVGDIQVLEGLEPVRKRPGMYIGSTGHRGLHHLVYEVVDNSVDEALAGCCTSIDVTICEDSSVCVIDNGRGIPVKIMPRFGRPAVEIVMTKLHAGGKFGGEGYKVSGGLHGVGVSVVNALSEWLTVEVCREGSRWRPRYERGVPVTDLENVGDCGDEQGTSIHFKPDPQIFDDLYFNFTTLSQRLREVAFLNRSLHISLVDQRDDEVEPENAAADEDDYYKDYLDRTAERVFSVSQVDALGTADETAGPAQPQPAKKRSEPKSVAYCYDGGIVDFVKHLNQHKDALHPRVIHFEGEEDDYNVELAMQWNAGYNDNVFSFANNINTHEGGSHLSGFRSAITRTIND